MKISRVDIIRDPVRRRQFIGNCPLPELNLWLSSPTLQYGYPTDFWILENAAGEMTQRIAATTPRNMRGVGFIGLMASDFESLNVNLLKTAEIFLNSCQCENIYFPVNFSTWFNYRVTEKRENLSFNWEPPPLCKVESALDEQCYRIVKRYLTFGYESQDFSKARRLLGIAADKASKKGFTLNGFDSYSDKKALLEQLHSIALHSFSQNYLFSHLEKQDFCNYYLGMLASKDCSKSFVLENSAHQICGFIFSFIDKNFVVIKSLAVDRNILTGEFFGRLPLSFALLHKVFESCKDDTLLGGISAFMENSASSLTLAGTQKWAHSWTHKYNLYGKSL